MKLSAASKARCRSCNATVVWAENSVTGKRMPVDPDPVEGGNIVETAAVSTSGHGGTPVVRVLGKGEPHGGPRFVSHFVTCPDAAQHRRSR